MDDRMLKYHLGDSHPMNSNRVYPAFELIRELFVDVDEFSIIKPTNYEPSIVDLAHSDGFIEAMQQLSLYGLGEAPEFGLGVGDCPVFPDMHEAAEFVVNSTVSTAERIMKDGGMAFSMLGGLHHARKSKASGFCYYNDINVAINKLKQANNDIKVLYIDTDVHHGDGTQFEFYDDPDVLTLSFHESGQFIFPGTGFSDEIGINEGTGYSINLPFFPYTWDDIYVDSFKKIIPSIFQSFNQDIVIWQSGVDSNKDDYLGHLQLSLNSFRDIAEVMRDQVNNHMDNPRLVTLGGGGYNQNSVAKSWSTIIAGLSNTRLPKNASEEWKERCGARGIGVNTALHEERTVDRVNEEYDIADMNDQYMDELDKYISPYFSI